MMNNLKSNHHLIAPVLLVIGGVVILQYHAMQFWAAHTGADIGWAWSLLIEVAGLWLWYQPDFLSRFLGAMASIILLAAPLYHLGSGAWQQVEATTAGRQSVAQQEALLRESIARYDQTIEDFTLNSKHKAGWAKEIEKVQLRLDQDKSALLALLAQPARSNVQHVQKGVQSVTSLIATVILQCSALVVIQLANIKAMLFLSRTLNAQPVARQYVQHVTNNNTQINVLTADQHDHLLTLKHRCQEHLSQHQLTSSAFAESCNIKRQQVSFLLNYEPGARKPSKEALDVLEGVLV